MPRARRRLQRSDLAGSHIDLQVERVVAGGDGLAHGPDGRVLLVEGALPGERVRAEVVETHKSWSRAVAREVIEPATGRRSPPCEQVARGCGGCSWQHAEPRLQRALKRQIVSDALRRLGGICGLDAADERILDGPELAVQGFRTTVRAAVSGGRAGFRKTASHETLPVDDCLVAHQSLVELFR